MTRAWCDEICTTAVTFAFLPISSVAATIGDVSAVLGTSSGSGPSPQALADIPAGYLAL